MAERYAQFTPPSEHAAVPLGAVAPVTPELVACQALPLLDTRAPVATLAPEAQAARPV